MFYQAYDLFDNGKYHECLPMFLNIAEDNSDPKFSYWSLIFAGRCKAIIGHDDAIDFFQRAMDIFPTRAEAIFEAGNLEYLRGRTKESERLLTSISNCEKPINCVRYEGDKYFEGPHEILIEMFINQFRFNDAEELSTSLLRHGDRSVYDVARAEYNHLYARHFNNIGMEFVKAKTIQKSDELIIQLPSGYDGLGDNLVFSHIPRIAKQFGGFKKVFVSNQNSYKGEGYADIVWAQNPYVDGFTDEEGTYSSVSMNRIMDKWNNVQPSLNLMDSIMILHDLDDGSRGNVPECYYRPNIIKDLTDKVVLDLGSKTIDLKNLNIRALLDILNERGIFPDYIISHQNFDEVKRLETSSMWHWADIMSSAKTYVCFNSGGYWLSKALGVSAKHIWIDKKNLPAWSYLDHENIMVNYSTIFL